MDKIFSTKINIIIIVLWLIISTNTNAQNDSNQPRVVRSTNVQDIRVRVKSNTQELSKSNLTNRDSLFNTISATNLTDASWSRIVYRKLDLNNPSNATLYYPETPLEDSQNLFCRIFRLLNNNQIRVYEYIDAIEVFNAKHQLSFIDLLDKFNINYTQEGQSNTPSSYKIEDIDIPSNEVKSYYIKEAYYFDFVNSTLSRKVLAICPILTEFSEYGESINKPMFWVKYDDIKAYLSNDYVMLSSINNVSNYTLSDYFDLNLYSGEIVKTKNLLNKSINQMASSADSIKIIQDKIENEIKTFEKAINNEQLNNKVYNSNQANIKDSTKNSRDKRVKPKKSIDRPAQKTTIRSSRSVRK